MTITEHSGVVRISSVMAPIRRDIQALRAIAVLMVVIYHLWPSLITGGYAGVDVFFVISGFLITAHLLREVDRDGRVRLAAFWARRIRRLLPAALLVLLVSVIGVLAFVPDVYRIQFFRDISAASSYFLNWTLAADAVDYLAAENIASPVQHYWSLSVEEQFYVVWPLLVLLAIGIASLAKSTRVRTSIAIVLTLVTLASFVYSVYATVSDQAGSYFVTPGRAWEFGVGGLLALFAEKIRTHRLAVRAIVAWLGWAAILVTAFVYSAQTPFPGYLALLPVLGTAAVIWADDPALSWAPTRALSIRPVGYLGDISYSLYLWHWPLIIIGGFALGSELNTVQKIVILAASILLADLTRRFVEDPFRKAGTRRKRATPLAFIGAVAGMALVLGSSGSALYAVELANIESAKQLNSLLEGQTPCLGAAAVIPGEESGCDNPNLDGVLVPTVSGLHGDTGDAFLCYATAPTADLAPCSYGSKKPDALRVALVGDSHAAMLIPGMTTHLDELNWTLDTYVARGCTWIGTEHIQADDPCRDRQLALADRFENQTKYDLIIVASRRSAESWPTARTTGRQIADGWAPVLERGTRVVAVVDNPTVSTAGLECVAAANGSLALSEKCVMTQKEAFPTADPLRIAVEKTSGSALVDLTDLYCSDNECPMVIGHVIAYRDGHHITATFSTTMAPYLLDRITKELTPDGS